MPNPDDAAALREDEDPLDVDLMEDSAGRPPRRRSSTELVSEPRARRQRECFRSRSQE